MDDAVKAQLTPVSRAQWRSLPEAAGESAIAANVGTINAAGEIRHPFVSRREFVEWVAALTALLGTSACTRQPEERILPYAKAPEQIVPGRPLFFATTMSLWGTG